MGYNVDVSEIMWDNEFTCHYYIFQQKKNVKLSHCYQECKTGTKILVPV